VSCTHGGLLEAEQAKHAVNATAHQSIVRSLRYLMNTYPNPAFVVGYVSHFLEEPWEDHLAAVKKILRYVTGTCNWRLWFGRKKGNKTLLTGFSDADFAGDVDTRKKRNRSYLLLGE
jgi:hypothetical protein